MASAEEVVVFVETNLGTHIAMEVPLDVTAGDFKRRLEETHTNCLPILGEIQVYGLMVKRKSNLYYIPEPVPIKHIFRDSQKAWFICAEARCVNSSSEPCVPDSIHEAEVVDCYASDKPVEGRIGLSNGKDGKTKTSLAKHVPEADVSTSANKEICKERVSCAVTRMLDSEQVCLDGRSTSGSQTPDPETTHSLSVAEASDIRDSDFTLTCCLRSGSKNLKPKTAARNSHTENERVRRKLLVAANNIKTHGKIQISSSISSIYRSKNERRRLPDRKTVASLAKFLVFQIPETESEKN